jgi:hypothetical protein
LKSILDSSFKYTHSSATDVRKTFARVRLEQQAQVGGEEDHAQIRPTASVTKVIVRRVAQPAS